ncbi:MAG: alpha/beta hydrolase fold protein [Ilumatobacteraceae bacterium]|nr:alpha/beta hydrolase fold protein [Ilumatobacteraceae bacterium]
MPTTTTADGVRIEYVTVGAGPDVVLVHGITDSSLTWGPIPQMLAEHFRVTTLDLRGMGASGDAGDYGSFAMVNDLAAVVEAADVSRPLVIGHSLGGIVVTGYASGADVRGVINVDQPLRLSDFQAALQQVEGLLRDPATFPSVVQAVFDGMDGDMLSDDLRADIASHRRQRQEVVLGVWDQVFHTPVAELDGLMAQVAAGISAPYLSLQFIDPGVGYAEWLRGLIPQAVVEQWVGEGSELGDPVGQLGHYGHRVDPGRFVERVIAFDQ